MPKTKLNRKFLEKLAADPTLKKEARAGEARKAKEVIQQVGKEMAGKPEADVLKALERQLERAGLTPQRKPLKEVAAAIRKGTLE